ncbi:MAG: DUF1178 family protein [Burkholderiales bacterium]|nr:DUF1178 family protein [Burkholderiales bacterium]
MIVFDLRCPEGHRFEGWFGSAEDFETQRASGLIACPNCGRDGVERMPSAVRLNLGASPPGPRAEEPGARGDGRRDPFSEAHLLYSRLLDELLARSEDVGEAFPAEARRIHRGEAPARAIRGQASLEEHEALLEEGIPVVRLPIPPRDRMN